LLRPQAFNSVKISVKNPGSALMRSILELKRFNRRRQLDVNEKKDEFNINYPCQMLTVLLTDPKIYPSTLQPGRALTDN